MRTAALAKVGFYATPPEALRRLTAILHREGSGVVSILDPCAGEGDALASVTDVLQGEPYAVEVQRDRATLCRERFGHVIWGDAFRLRLSHSVFSLLWLNPPYDKQAAAKGAYELKFLKELDRALAPGGVLVYLIPRDRLAAAATYLGGHYQDVRVWRFPAGEYEVFSQVAVIARRREVFLKDDVTQLRLQRLALGWTADRDLPELPQPGTESVDVPAQLDGDEPLFASADLDTDALLAALNGKGSVWAHPSVQQKLWPSGTYRARPLMPLRQGHLALLLAAGYLDNAVIPTSAGRLLVKGRISKDVVVVSVDEEKGKRVERERLNVAINVLNADTGQITTYNGDQLGEFVGTYRTELAEAVVRTFPALYGIADRERMPLNFLKRSPMGAQSDVIRAIALSLRRHRGTILVGVPGTGKTFTAAAVARLAGCKRIFVLCPPHLTRKWCREVELALPSVRTVILRTPADLDIAMQMPASVERPVFMVCSRETAKLGYRQCPAAISRSLRLSTERGQHMTVRRLCCPDCLCELEDKDGRPLDITELQGHRVKHVCRHCREVGGHQAVCRTCWGDAIKDGGRKGQFACKRCCGATLQTADRQGPRRQEMARYLAARYRGKVDLFIGDEIHECKGGTTAQGRAMGVLASACKRSLALSGTLYSGYASGMFYLLHRLLPEFRQEFRYVDETVFVEKYGVFEMTYSKTFDATSADSDLNAETGIVSKRGRERVTRREKPGMSPALLLHVIECSAFLRLEDVADSLPPLREEVSTLMTEEPLTSAYHELEGAYLAAARQAGFGRKLAVMGSMVQNCLAYPDTCVAPLTVELREKGEPWLTIRAPALPVEISYPKEAALVELVGGQKRRGRRVIAYYSNTHTRDVAPRLLGLLRGAGLRADVLTVAVKPELRESWIEKRVGQGLDVLLINAQLVETGLDLLWFPTVAWYQVNYRTTTVRQASRRSWRIGQRLPVEIYHLVYAGTVQTAALQLIARKVHSSNLFDGDLSESGLNEMVEDESLVSLAKQLLEDAIPRDGGLEELFANREQVIRREERFLDDSFSIESISPPFGEVVVPSVIQVSLPTAESAETLTRLLAQQEQFRAEQVKRSQRQAERRLRAVVETGQLVLFPEAA